MHDYICEVSFKRNTVRQSNWFSRCRFICVVRVAFLGLTKHHRNGLYLDIIFNTSIEGKNWRGLRDNEDLPMEFAKELGLNIDQLEKDINYLV